MLRYAIKAHTLSAVLIGGVAMADAASAENMSVVSSRDTFVALVKDRELRRFGIRLSVTPDGEISGRAFGTPVTGEWNWDGGYFCRDLFFGDEDLGFNCQLVQVNGGTLRFTSDQGSGMSADLTLR